MNDKEIVDALYRGEKAALNHVAERYRRLYTSILRQVLNNESDVEECANDCLLAVWDSIPPTRPDNLGAYVCKIARRIGINRYHHNTREKRGQGYTVLLSELEEAIPDEEDCFASVECPSLGETISRFLTGIDRTSRILFVRRYFYMESVKSLAERFYLRENAVSARLHRTRRRLKAYLEKESPNE